MMNHIKSLKYSPSVVKGDYIFTSNLVESFEYLPKTLGGLYATHNKIKSIDFIPSHVKGDIFIAGNDITDLHDIHKKVQYCGGEMWIRYNPIKSNILGLLLIDGLKKLDLSETEDLQRTPRDNAEFNRACYIISKYLKDKTFSSPKQRMIACQNEMIDKGLEDYAQL
jgi:hypothetical protein